MNVRPYMLFSPHTEGIEHLVVRVGAEREGEIVFRLEFILRSYRVGRDAENRGFDLLELGPQALKSIDSWVQPGVSALG